jgi:hypothetical protein
MRLRFRAHGAPPVPSAPSVALQIGVDAVLTPTGKLEHAESAAHAYADSLRHAAVSIDRARWKMRRRDPDGALEAWRSLVEGEWSLVEIFESDGRRFMVARRNAPDAPHAPLLDAREARRSVFARVPMASSSSRTGWACRSRPCRARCRARGASSASSRRPTSCASRARRRRIDVHALTMDRAREPAIG